MPNLTPISPLNKVHINSSTSSTPIKEKQQHNHQLPFLEVTNSASFSKINVIADDKTDILDDVLIEATGPAATISIQTLRDPHTFVSKRVVTRNESSSNSRQYSLIERDINEKSTITNKNLTMLQAPSPFKHHINSCSTSITDECVITQLSCRDEPLNSAFNRRGIELCSQISRRSSDTSENIPIAFCTTPILHSDSHDIHNSSTLRLSRRKKHQFSHVPYRTQPETSQIPSHGILHTEHKIDVNTNNINNININEDEYIEDACTPSHTSRKSDGVSLSLDTIGWGFRHNVPPINNNNNNNNSVGNCPNTPLSVIEELADECEACSFGGSNAGVQLQDTQWLSLPRHSPLLTSKNNNNNNNNNNRTGGEGNVRVITPGRGGGGAVRIVRRNLTKGFLSHPNDPLGLLH